jgi:fermentation-respiration switch protein FrsA (DUF1100 family)
MILAACTDATSSPTQSASPVVPATITPAPNPVQAVTPSALLPAPLPAIAGPPGWFKEIRIYPGSQKFQPDDASLAGLELSRNQYFINGWLSSDPVLKISDFYSTGLTTAGWKVVQRLELGKPENGIQLTLNRFKEGKTQVLVVLVANPQGLEAAPQTRQLAGTVPADRQLILLIAQNDNLPLTPVTPETTNLPTGLAAENLSFAFGDGWTSQGQLTYPAGQNGPFPLVILVHESGAQDMNESVPESLAGVPGGSKIFQQIAYYLPTRGFAVLRYNRRGVIGLGPQLTNDPKIVVTHTKLTQDAGFVLGEMLKNPKIDPRRVIMLGHSEGTLNVSSLVTSPAGQAVAGVVLMGVQGYDIKTLLNYQVVDRTLQYAKDSDLNHDGKLSYEEFRAAYQPVAAPLRLLDPQMLYQEIDPTDALKVKLQKSLDKNGDNLLDIDNELQPFLKSLTEKFPLVNLPGFGPGAVSFLQDWQQSGSVMQVLPTFQKPVLLLNGEGDTQTPVQAAREVDAALTKTGNPDHKLITYPKLGHTFYPVNGLVQPLGPLQEQVLKDLADWLGQRYLQK